MKKPLLFLFLFSLFTYATSQDSLCFEYATGSYWPLENGQVRKYAAGDDQYTSTISSDGVIFNGKIYVKETEVYKSGKEKITYWREENGAVFSFDKEKEIESMELPSNPLVGMKWKSTNLEWSYEIVSLESTYSTPFCDFTNLLKVKTESNLRRGTVYTLYYKKGVGMVGLNVNGNPYSFILPPTDKRPKISPFLAKECENLTDTDLKWDCTIEKMAAYFKENYKAPAKSKRGKFKVKLIVGEDGKIIEVIALKGPNNSEKQIEEITRVFKSMPAFIPAQKGEGKPIKMSIDYPLKL